MKRTGPCRTKRGSSRRRNLESYRCPKGGLGVFAFRVSAKFYVEHFVSCKPRRWVESGEGVGAKPCLVKKRFPAIQGLLKTLRRTYCKCPCCLFDCAFRFSLTPTPPMEEYRRLKQVRGNVLTANILLWVEPELEKIKAHNRAHDRDACDMSAEGFFEAVIRLLCVFLQDMALIQHLHPTVPISAHNVSTLREKRPFLKKL